MVVFKILRYIFFPSSRFEDFEIVPQSEVDKMSKAKLILEKVKSRRRQDEYYNLTINRIRVRRVLQIAATLLVWLLVVVAYNTSALIVVKRGDLILVSILATHLIGLSIWVLSRKKRSLTEENVLAMTVKELRLTLRNDLKREWRFIDRQNIIAASAHATMSSAVIMFFLSGVSAVVAAEKKGVSLYAYVENKLAMSCDRIMFKSLGVDFRHCDMFSIHIGFYFMFVIIIHELFDIITAPPGSGKYYGRQGVINEFVSSVYIDNISLSYLNPSNHETT